MGFVKNVTSTFKQIFNNDDDVVFDNDADFNERQGINIPKINFGAKKGTLPSFDSNKIDFNNLQYGQTNKPKSNGKLQVFVPKSYDQAFDIVKDVKNGSAGIVNVEYCNPQVGQRIIDILTGAVYALGGECKKLGEKQYVFSLSQETIGGMDYIPYSGNNYNNMNPQNMSNQGFFNNNNAPFGSGQPFSFNEFQPNQNGFQTNFNQNQNQNQNGFNQNNFYNPPQNQF